ncbi:MAG: hypothetical protein OXK17_00815 [Thaumarchaeota archaeon]|nr:hypothetical protein [Nitrososphaerota archaeon]
MEELVTRGDICDALERPGFVITHAPAKPTHEWTIVHSTGRHIMRRWADLLKLERNGSPSATGSGTFTTLDQRWGTGWRLPPG